jgi:hypothetical protein
MQKLQRNIAMTFRVTEEERELIRQKQKMTGIINLRAYLLKMAVDGRVIHVELDSVRDMNFLLGNISNNINQIARRVNQTGRIYTADVEEIRGQFGEISVQQKEILRRLNKVMEVV